MASFKLSLSAALLAAAAAKQLTVNVYYETNCPYSQQFINGQVGPIWNQPGCLKPYVDFHWVPYGMAQRAMNGVINCQHGPDECIGNRVQLCAARHFGQTDQLTEFIVCMEQRLAVPGTKAASESTYEHCAPGIARELAECANSEASQGLLEAAAAQTAAARPTVAPYVVFSNAPSYNLFGSQLKDNLCAELRGAKPACCGGGGAHWRRLRGGNLTFV